MSRNLNTRWLAPVVALAGALAAALLATQRGVGPADAAYLVVASAGGALVFSVVGWWALGPLRRASVRAQAVAVAVLVVTATAVGVVIAAEAMFISPQDFTVVLVVLVAAGSAGSAAGMRLGEQVLTGSRAIEELAAGIGDGSAHRTASRPPDTYELANLADKISEVSAELETARARERGLEHSRRELIAWISHDLRGPLSSIRAMAEALEDGVVDDPQTAHRYHATTRAECERLTTMVDDLFELSRINAGATGLHLELVPLRGVVDDAVETVAARAERSGVTIERCYQALPTMKVSVRELSRVLHNLLDNAIRHTPSGGRIRVEGSTREDGTGLIVVADQCGGIPDGDLGRVFDLAFRGDVARGRNGGGGLGLTIAKGLVEAHHGSLAVDNSSGGCCFTVALPDSPPAAEVPAPANA